MSQQTMMGHFRQLALLASMAWLCLSAGPVRGGPGLPIPPGGRASARGTVGQIVAVTDPMVRQVVQRLDDNRGNIVFMGTFAGPIDGFQARSSLRPGMSGVGQDWAPLIDVSFAGQRFSGVYRQAAGGFYDLQIRPTYRGRVGAVSTVHAVGVGEVFITAGQSNTTNSGDPTGFIPDLRVSAFAAGPGLGIIPGFPGANWQWGIDPQPVVDGSLGGSVWPQMASNLAIVTGVPIGLYSIGWQSTPVADWLPGLAHFDRLATAISYFKVRGGVRAVLWDQGESDTAQQTDPTVYAARLRAVIDQSRLLTGVPVKWMVARATGPPGTNPPVQQALSRAQASVTDGLLTFLGPDTDLLGYPYRQPPSVNLLHFNAAGLQLLGDWWGIYVVYSRGFLAPGLLPIQ